MYYSNQSIILVFISFLLSVCGERDLFEKKCKRECNTEYGTLDCWKRTTNGFAYGLSTAMIDYCQVILQLRQMKKESWYDISHKILVDQIKKYSFNKKVRQLSLNDTENISTLLLKKCFYDSSSQSSFQPSCPSCSIKQIKLINQWRIIIFILTSICFLFILIILFLYVFHIPHNHRSYESIS